jgi:hypothetical protein
MAMSDRASNVCAVHEVTSPLCGVRVAQSFDVLRRFDRGEEIRGGLEVQWGAATADTAAHLTGGK